MVNIVHFAMTIAQFHQCSDGYYNVFNAQNMQFGFFFAYARKGLVEQSAIPVVFLCGQQFLLIRAGVKFHAPYPRQIITFFLEEQAVK